ncbi:hypothetical protein HK101_001661 [Irineochytrium annulatum]|nr:hypothetical protein HK101_001661 [Irineochytrium annulatum]
MKLSIVSLAFAAFACVARAAPSVADEAVFALVDMDVITEEAVAAAMLVNALEMDDERKYHDRVKHHKLKEGTKIKKHGKKIGKHGKKAEIKHEKVKAATKKGCHADFVTKSTTPSDRDDSAPWTTYEHKSIKNQRIRIKEDVALCDPDVRQIVGYLDVFVGDSIESARSFFFWFFESRSNPAEDPLVLWLNGGPGCSSFTGLLMELGPCQVNEGGNSTSLNPESWNTEANILFLDQPTNVGFSYSNTEGDMTWSTAEAAKDVFALLQLFLSVNPDLAENDFIITGESYAGHYIPAIATEVLDGNELAKDPESGLLPINMVSIAIGNGITDPAVQYEYYSKFACGNSYGPIFEQEECDELDKKFPFCKSLIEACGSYDSAFVCAPATMYCQSVLRGPFEKTGLNVYDIRKKCDPSNPLCYPILNDIETYLNLPETQFELGVDRVFQSCNMDVGLRFQITGDGVRNFQPHVARLLGEGVSVLIYAGDADFACNWMGNQAWSLEMEWHGKEGFNDADEFKWVSERTGRDLGTFRMHKGLAFLRVFEAGHMVPYDQPEHSNEFLNAWLGWVGSKGKLVLPLAAECTTGRTPDDDAAFDQAELVRRARSLLNRSGYLLDSLEAITRRTTPSLPKHQAHVSPSTTAFTKLISTVKAEKRFLEKLVQKPETIKACHVECSNLTFLDAVLTIIMSTSSPLSTPNLKPRKTPSHSSALSDNIGSVLAVFKAFSYSLPGRGAKTVRVDVVMRGGVKWVKVKAGKMNGVGVELDDGDDESDDEQNSDEDNEDEGVARPQQPPVDDASVAPLISGMTTLEIDGIPILRQARQLLIAAEQNPVHFRTPEVTFVFVRGEDGAEEPVDERILDALRAMGVTIEVFERGSRSVWGPGTDDEGKCDDWEAGDSVGDDVGGFYDPDSLLTSTLNLDVTAMISLVTDMTNCFHSVPKTALDIPALKLQSVIRKLQAEQEETSPLLPQLISVLRPPRELVTTFTALSKMADIVKVVGGPREKLRAISLFDPASVDLVEGCLAVLDQLGDGSDVKKEDREWVLGPLAPLRGRVRVIPDDPSARFLALMSQTELKATTVSDASKKKKAKAAGERAGESFQMAPMQINIFGTGDKKKYTTVTANGGLLRSLNENGIIGHGVYIHDPRSLVESRQWRKKEKNDVADVGAEMKNIKKELKDWERSFTAREGRKPDRKDIAADPDINRRYKAYGKLKATVEGREAPVSLRNPTSPPGSGRATAGDIGEPSSDRATSARAAENESPRRRSTVHTSAHADAGKKRSSKRREKEEEDVDDDDEAGARTARNSSSSSSGGAVIPDSKVSRPRPPAVAGVQQRRGVRTSTTHTGRASESSRSVSGPAVAVTAPAERTNAVRGDVLADPAAHNPTPPPAQPTQPGATTVKANYLSKDALYASTSQVAQQQQQEDPSLSIGAFSMAQERQRPWGAGAALPDNFKLRKSTIASGPMPTDEELKAVQAKKLEEERSSSSKNYGSLDSFSRPYSPGNAFYSFDDGPVDPFRADFGRSSASTLLTSTHVTSPLSPSHGGGEYKDFMQRRNLIADPSSTPPSLASPLSSSPTRPVAGSPATASGLVSAIAVAMTSAGKIPNSGSMGQLPLPSPPRKIDLSAFAKPYDPTEGEDDELEVRPEPAKPSAARRLAVKDDSDEDDDDDDDDGPVTRGGADGRALGDEEPEFSSTLVTNPVGSPPPKTKKVRKNRLGDDEDAIADADADADADEGANAVTPLAGPAPLEELVTMVGQEEDDKEKSNGNEIQLDSSVKPTDMLVVMVHARVPQDQILRCKLYRKKNLLEKSYPSFFLYNEANDRFLLAARKRKKSKSVNYLISTSQEDLTKEGSHYAAKLRANYQRTVFTLFDARTYNKNEKDKGLKELAAITYSKTVLPREMSVAIPSLNVTEELENLTTDIMTDVKNQNTDKLLFLGNKPPRWNETTQSHCLNFGGRVTQPSIKNFQLIVGKNDSYIIMQFGRCGPDYFTLDVRYPMTPLEAFAIALTTFDAYDSA